MIVVLFHMLYLLGKQVYENYYAKRLRRPSIGMEIADTQYHRDKRKVDEDELDVPVVKVAETIKFSPPAYIQRYVRVTEVLEDPKYNAKLRKVVDFGCSELGFIPYLKNLEGIEDILCIDVDNQVLEHNEYKAKPLSADYLHQRLTPLQIEIFEGSVTYKDKRLDNTDAVICIELIEHLYESVLKDLPYNIFGYIVPKVVVITTPNADFNVLFPNFEGFRHPDHKFEWTRKQFQDWAYSIVRSYPYYSVTFEGICDGPAGTEEFGTCTQMAIFDRLENYVEIMTETRRIKPEGTEGLLKTLFKYEYPYYVDNRTDEQKILDEAVYYINFLSFKHSNVQEEVYLDNILLLMRKFSPPIETLRTILVEAGWTVEDRENGPVVVPQMLFPSDSSIDSDIDFADNETDWYQSWFEDDEDSDDVIWCEEPSIVIPQNYSVNQDNTYLFDGEGTLTEEQSISEVSTAIRNDIGQSRGADNEESVVSNELPDNLIIHALDKSEINSITEKVDINTSSALAQTVALPNDVPELSGETKNSLIDNIAMQASLSQNVELNSRTMPETYDSKFTLRTHLSVSRSSTSPEPLLFNIELDNSAHNYSGNDQNESYSRQDLLNSTFESADKPSANIVDSISKDILELDKCLSRCHIYRKINVANRVSPNYSELDDSLNVEQDNINSMKYQGCQDSDTTDIESLNVFGTFNNHPRLTSSPRTCTKVLTTNLSKQGLIQDTDEKFAERKDAINRETDVNDVQRVDVHNILSLDDENIRKENGYCASIAAIRTYNVDTETRLENMNGDPAQLNISEKDLSTPRELLNSEIQYNSKSSSDCATGINILDDSFLSCKSSEDTNKTVVRFTSVLKSDEDIACDTKDFMRKDVNISNITGLVDNVEAKSSSPIFGTPSDSWSHEIVDSGYPNSASAQDITPENDLSSIAQDHIPDIESPSLAEAPRFGVLEPVEVENGDLANNNRDDEGNNMMAVDANDIEGLQPLIDVLENDLENENDIYVLENGFPIWLLRILDMANPLDFDIQHQQNIRIPDEIADDVNYIAHDEGFDSSSSENDSDIINNGMENDNE